MRKEERGITLIALVITIIVMLILVGVTVNIAIQGGLFETARKANLETRAALVEEKVVEWKATKEIDKYSGTETAQELDALLNDLVEQKLLTEEEKKEVEDTNQVTIGTRTIIFGETGQDTDLDLLKRYFLGENGEGKNLMNLVDVGFSTFKDDEETEEDESELASRIFTLCYFTVETCKDEVGEYWIGDVCIKYNDKVYILGVRTDSRGETILTKTLELGYTKIGREGKKYSFDINGDGTEEECTILYDYGSEIEIIAPDVVGKSLTLGYNDSHIKWDDENVKKEADIDNNNELSNIEKSIYSYNQSVKTINDYTREILKDKGMKEVDIRSVGSKPGDPYSENTTLYEYNEKYNKYNNRCKSTDANCEEDLIRMSYYGVVGINKNYFLASRSIACSGYNNVDEWINFRCKLRLE